MTIFELLYFSYNNITRQKGKERLVRVPYDTWYGIEGDGDGDGEGEGYGDVMR
jgi:hypothetical protein